MDSKAGKYGSPFRSNGIDVPSVPRISNFLFPQSNEDDTIAITPREEATTNSGNARTNNPVTPGGRADAITTTNNSSTTSSKASDPASNDYDETHNPVTPGGGGGEEEEEAITTTNSSTSNSTSSKESDSDDSSLFNEDNMYVPKRARTMEVSVNSVNNHSTAGSSAILRSTIHEVLHQTDTEKEKQPISEVSIPFALNNINTFQYSPDDPDDTSILDATEKYLVGSDSFGKSTDFNNSAALKEAQIVESRTASSLARVDILKQYQRKKVPQPQLVVPHVDDTQKHSIGKTLKEADKKPAVELVDYVPYPTGILSVQEQLFLNRWMKRERCDEHLMLYNVSNTEHVYNIFLKILKVMYQTKCKKYLTKKQRLPFASSEWAWNLRIIFQQWVHSLNEGKSEVDKVFRKNGYTETQVDMLDVGLYVHPLRTTVSKRYRSILENKYLKQYFVGKSWQNIHDKLRVHCKKSLGKTFWTSIRCNVNLINSY